MAGSARFTAILDACVLYPQLVRDILMRLTFAGLYHARWSATIENEWTRNLLEKMPGQARAIERTVLLMREAVPDCLVVGHESLIPGLELPDPDDRHVLAAAIAGHADAIVTYNLKDFPAEVLAVHHIEAQHPDEFIMNQFELHELAALTAIKEMRATWTHPARSAEELVKALELRGLPQTAVYLAEASKLI
ncbi:PIN domain-containing protein [Variovorax sp. J2P1-59]|uniref:PIN domain-containing protein n=1 Tax=Variovorax flavidus TaxID=3053501 RepID=UPI0025761486|nr:PIN domain-containing protein [Variovorax sp. J2P1-59]MDM0075353.1 PIN domain-containing protein [Variovorax sp. J2P1-59]